MQCSTGNLKVVISKLTTGQQCVGAEKRVRVCEVASVEFRGKHAGRHTLRHTHTHVQAADG